MANRGESRKTFHSKEDDHTGKREAPHPPFDMIDRRPTSTPQTAILPTADGTDLGSRLPDRMRPLELQQDDILLVWWPPELESVERC